MCRSASCWWLYAAKVLQVKSCNLAILSTKTINTQKPSLPIPLLYVPSPVTLVGICSLKAHSSHMLVAVPGSTYTTEAGRNASPDQLSLGSQLLSASARGDPGRHSGAVSARAELTGCTCTRRAASAVLLPSVHSRVCVSQKSPIFTSVTFRNGYRHLWVIHTQPVPTLSHFHRPPKDVISNKDAGSAPGFQLATATWPGAWWALREPLSPQ